MAQWQRHDVEDVAGAGSTPTLGTCRGAARAASSEARSQVEQRALALRTVASFLQRLGRTGRRPGTSRNVLFLAATGQALLRGAGLLSLWRNGFVEPVTAPPSPRHIAAQQILALCLQEGRVGEWWGDLPVFDEHASEIVHWLVATGHLDHDGGMLSQRATKTLTALHGPIHRQ